MSSADQAWRRLKATNPIDPELLPDADVTRLEEYKATTPRDALGTRRSALRAMRPALGVTALILGIGAVLLLALPRGTDSPSATPPSTSSPNLPGPSGSDGSRVIADFMDNGVIDGCYSDAEFAAALGELSADAQQYGSAVSAIEQRQVDCSGAAPRYEALDGPPSSRPIPAQVRDATAGTFDLGSLREIGPSAAKQSYAARGAEDERVVCLIVPAGSGYGIGCANPIANPKMAGVRATAVLNPDGSQRVTALVPSGVTQVDTPNGSLRPQRSSVTFTIRPGKSTIFLHSQEGVREVSLESYTAALPKR